MRRLVPIGVGLVVSAIAVAILLASMDFEGTLEVLASTDLRWLAAAGLVIALQVVLRTYRWRLILPRATDGRRIPARRLLPVLLVGYLGNAILPARLGEPLRAVLVSRREQVGMAEALGSVLLERILDLASLSVLLVGAAIVVGAPTWLIQAGIVAALIGLSVLAILATTGVVPLVAFGARHRAVARRRLLAVLFDQAERLASTIGGPQRRRVIGLASLMSLAAWLLEGTTYWLIGMSLGIDLTPAGAIVVAGIAVVGTALPSAPGYIGTFDLAAAVAAQALGVAGPSALAFALLVHVMTLVPLAVGGAVALVAMNIRFVSLMREASGRATLGPERTQL